MTSGSRSISRQPPAAVLTALRREVGFHCPAPSQAGTCGSPYLTWHHFDPPWRDERHHRVEGMIALCREHADKADNGAYTDDQLRRFKREAGAHDGTVSGRFDWMRNEVVVYAGGSYFVETPVILQIGGKNAIWFERNELGELSLNYRMPARALRTRIENNTWLVEPGEVAEIVAPPGGRSLSVRYENGDLFKTEYREIRDADEFVRRMPSSMHHRAVVSQLTYPVTVASITDVTKDGQVVLYPDRTTIQGGVFVNNWIERCGVAFAIDVPPEGLTLDQQVVLASAVAEFNDRFR